MHQLLLSAAVLKNFLQIDQGPGAYQNHDHSKFVAFHCQLDVLLSAKTGVMHAYHLGMCFSIIRKRPQLRRQTWHTHAHRTHLIDDKNRWQIHSTITTKRLWGAGGCTRWPCWQISYTQTILLCIMHRAELKGVRMSNSIINNMPEIFIILFIYVYSSRTEQCAYVRGVLYTPIFHPIPTLLLILRKKIMIMSYARINLFLRSYALLWIVHVTHYAAQADAP